VREDAAELVVLDLADEGSTPSEARDPDDGVRGRAPRHLDRRPHGVVDARRARLVDQLHGALVHVLPGEEVVVGARDDIDDGVADAEHVESS
jgi:hypothetical protein